MAWTPEKVTALLSQDGSTADRVAQLQELVAAVRGEEDGDGRDGLAGVVEKLADGARDASWRLPLGESGFLEYVLSVVPAKEPQDPLNKQALRLVGNACADCNENRARVVESGALRSFIMDIMKDAEQNALLPFTIAAALNACVDYKPAQEQASEAGLSRVLVDIVSGDRLSACQSFLGHAMTILELLTGQDAEPKVANPNTPALLLSLATSEKYDADLDTYMAVCTPALAYLTFQDMQPRLLENNGIELLQQAFHQLYTRFDVDELDDDTKKQLKQVGDGFLAVFADISALPGFATLCPLDSKPAQTLVDWLTSPALPHLQTAACLSLGNLSRSDESSTALVNRVKEPLLDILSRAIPPTQSQTPTPNPTAPPLQLTHASLSFLKNLAIAQANKPVLGAALLGGTAPLLPSLWTSTRTQPQLQFTAISLTRLLLANCPPNIHHICTPLPDSNEPPYQSNLALLTATAAAADEDPIKMEAARAVSLVCRALHSSPVTDSLDPSWTWPSSPPSPDPLLPTNNNQSQNDAVLTRFYTAHTPTITPSLTHLLTQPRFPTVRSEAIFVLALMSRSPAGAHMAQQVLPPPSPSPNNKNKNGAAAWQVLAQAITGSESESASDELAALFGAPSSSSRIEEIKDEDEDEDEQVKENKDKDKEDGGVTVEKLSLEPQQIDPLAQKQQPARVAKMDRENAMVLVAELLRQFPEELSGLRRPLEGVLDKGGELVMQDREQQG